MRARARMHTHEWRTAMENTPGVYHDFLNHGHRAPQTLPKIAAGTLLTSPQLKPCRDNARNHDNWVFCAKTRFPQGGTRALCCILHGRFRFLCKVHDFLQMKQELQI